MKKRLDDLKTAPDTSEVPLQVVELKKNINALLDDAVTTSIPTTGSTENDAKLQAAVKFMDATKKSLDNHYTETA